MCIHPSRLPYSARVLTIAAVSTSLLGACAFQDEGDASGAIAVAASDTACDVERSESKAGTVTFNVRNEGTKVTEFYVYAKGDRIMSEAENIGPGLSRDLIVELPAGRYQTACKPGMRGKGIRHDFTVIGQAEPRKNTDAKLKEATESYKRYVISQTQALTERTTEFVNAVKSGDKAEAKRLYPISRVYFERIESVAGSFGDLDPAIDEREDDPSLAGPEFSGFHPIEAALWRDNDISGSGPIADRLLADVKELERLAKDVDLTPLDLANGSKGLLDEVAVGKITGEENRYSHHDVSDIDANVDGSRAAINALRPVLEEEDPKLLATIDERFTAMENELAKHQRGDGYRFHNELSEAELKELATVVSALSESVGKVAAVVAQR